MKVKKLVSMFDGITINSICAWNGRGNTPSKGFSFKDADALCDAYGNEEVKSWELSGKFAGYTELNIRMYGTEM